ncbi:hypothetical protein PG984_007150 [Apiospora sp. TS-2023a]
MPPPRSAGTCVQCRTRKVRCSGGAPCCSNCERLDYACSFAVVAQSQRGDGDGSSSSTKLEKRRRPLACVTCRSTKSKCTGERPCCEPCRTRLKECVYPDSKRRKSYVGSEQTRSPGGQSNPPRQRPRIPPQDPGFSERVPFQYSPQTPLDQIPESVATSSELYAERSSTEAISPFAGSFPGEYDAASAGGPASETFRGSASNFIVDSPGRQPTTNDFPKVHEQLQIINDYFRHIYAHPGSAFLSEVSVTKRCLEGTMDEAVLLALCAYTASVLRYPRYYPAHSASWVQKAEDLLWSSIESPTVFRTQALLLAVLCRVETGNFKRGYMLLSMASRSASAMRLQYERLDLDHHSQEVRRRLTWSIMLIDNYFSVGLPESGTCPPDFIYLKMPCPEEDFHGDGATGPSPASASLDGVSEGGLLQLYIRLSIIRRDILRLTRNLSLQVNVMPQITGLVEGMLKSLTNAKPPPYTTKELQRYSTSRWFVRYTAVQIGWHQSHCDIYRIFLSGYREAAPDDVIRACAPDYVAQAAASCLRHARAIIDIIHTVHSLRLPLVFPPRDICIGGYHASRLLLFLSRSELIPPDQNITSQMATKLAKETLAILRPLFGSSAMLGKTVQELGRIISAHVSGAPVYPGEASEPDSERTRRGSRPRYAMTIQMHTSLGVHSAFRQAQFHEDDEEARGIGTGTNNNTHPESDSSATAGIATTTRQQPKLVPSVHAGSPVMLSSEHSGKEAEKGRASFSDGEGSEEMVPFGISPESMDLSSLNLDIWSARGWQHDFSPGSSHDCI